eukprot:scaffold195571_cov31-Tisochrysis_lutea.AAC.3
MEHVSSPTRLGVQVREAHVTFSASAGGRLVAFHLKRLSIVARENTKLIHGVEGTFLWQKSNVTAPAHGVRT